MSNEDRGVLLSHATSSVTKIYTHPNMEVAQELINKPAIITQIKNPTILGIAKNYGLNCLVIYSSYIFQAIYIASKIHVGLYEHHAYIHSF